MAGSTNLDSPIGLRWRSHPTFILSTVAIGLFNDLFLYNLIIPVLPLMLEDNLRIPPSQIQQYNSAMLAVYAGSNVISRPIAGILADRTPNRGIPFLFALLCLLGATLMSFLGKTVTILLVARVLQGISSGFVWTIGLAMCIETVGVNDMGKTMGTTSSITALGSLWAPFLGGTLYQKAGMRGVAAIAVAVIAIDLIMRLLVVEQKAAGAMGQSKGVHDDNEADQKAHREEQLLLNHAPDEAFKLPDQQHWIKRAIPLLPCLANPSLLTALLGSLMQAILMGSVDSTVAVIAHDLFAFDSFQAGLLFLAPGTMSLAFGPIFGWIVDRHGTKPAAVFSFSLLVPVLALLRFVHAGGLPQILLYAILLTVASIGLAGSGSPSIVEAGAVIERYHRANPGFFGSSGPYAMVYGMNGMLFNAGLTIGPVLAGELKEKIGYGI